jgi:asparagine synthase (glutamine-hydrolysing)
MAGIAGIYCADGRPADLADLRRMAAAVEDRGPDGITYWNAGPVAFAYLQFCTTPESLAERQPLLSSAGDACLVWNGRLDNRKELLDALSAGGRRSADHTDRTDPGLVLAAYLQWGTECVERLVGDFALAVWDARLRRLWCARDYVGTRPFYYYWDGKTFLFGPEHRALLAHPLVSLNINEGMAGEFLANAITSRDETLYSDIRRLPSGSTLTIDGAGNFRIANWWNPELSPLEYRTDDEYAEHFRQLMDESVLSRMRCNTHWGVELSGGLDSSAIAGTAQAVMDRGEDRALIFSMACPGKPWDESKDIDAVVRHAGLRGETVPQFKAGLSHFRQRAAYWRDYPGTPNGEPMTIPMGEAARRHRARVLLNGIGGDEFLQGSLAHTLDLAAKGKIRELLRQAKGDWQVFGRHSHWSIDLTRQLLAGATPKRLHLQRRTRNFAQNSFLSREFLRRTNLADRLFSEPDSGKRRFSSRAQAEIFSFVTDGAEAHIFEWNDRETAHAGIEMRYPFFDRRLAEFCLRIPEDQRRRGNVTKYVLRNAMRDRLPEQVRTKTMKAEFFELFETVLYDPESRARLKNPILLSQTDWLDGNRFLAQIDLPEQPPTDFPRYGQIWMAVGIDLWLENVLAFRQASIEREEAI